MKILQYTFDKNNVSRIKTFILSLSVSAYVIAMVRKVLFCFHFHNQPSYSSICPRAINVGVKGLVALRLPKNTSQTHLVSVYLSTCRAELRFVVVTI